MNEFVHKPEAKAAAIAVLGKINKVKSKAISDHKEAWSKIWDNPKASPQEIFDELGSEGGIVLVAGSLQVDYITLITDAINNRDGSSYTAADWLGDPKYLTTGKPVTVNEDGTVTVGE
jgi:hypothetical protein